jgi:transcriptional regulator GlxA family with amidase domain
MGAHGVNYQPNETELAYVRKAYEESTAFITICGGIQAPLLAGVLKGKSATGPRPLLPMAKLQAPDTEWHEKRWHRDGKLWTSGALLNGLDLMAAFVTEYWGGEGSLVEFMLHLGHYPVRDVNYADAPSKR